jgi:hypothetical protein
MSIHRCFELADEKLKAKNTKLAFAMQIPGGQSRLIIATIKVTRGPKPVLMLAGFCPFCGAKLDEEKPTKSKRATASAGQQLR